MSDLSFNTTSGQTIDRELLVLYLNTGTNSQPAWSAVGKRVTDSAMDFDWSDSSEKDILGNTHSTMKKPIITQAFDPLPLDAGDTAAVKLWNLAVKDQDVAALSNMDVMVGHFYVTSGSSNWAERYESSMIKITSLGGEGGGHIEMPIEVTYGGTRTLGTVSKNASTGVVTFTAASGSTN